MITVLLSPGLQSFEQVLFRCCKINWPILEFLTFSHICCSRFKCSRLLLSGQGGKDNQAAMADSNCSVGPLLTFPKFEIKEAYWDLRTIQMGWRIPTKHMRISVIAGIKIEIERPFMDQCAENGDTERLKVRCTRGRKMHLRYFGRQFPKKYFERLGWTLGALEKTRFVRLLMVHACDWHASGVMNPWSSAQTFSCSVTAMNKLSNRLDLICLDISYI